MRILFITSTRIGDAVLSTGALAWVLARWPEARITIACGPAAAPLFEAVPNLERLHVLRKERGGQHWWRLWATCAGKFWYAVIDFRRSAMPYLLGVRKRYVLGRSDTRQHKIMAITTMLGERAPVTPRICIRTDHEIAARQLLNSASSRAGPLIAVAPTANWGGKEWPAERFAELCRRMASPGKLAEKGTYVIMSAPDEIERAGKLVELIEDLPVVDLRGRTDLLTAFACLRQVDMFIGNDSALMHLAAAADIFTLGLFGPSLDEVYGPWGARCSVVRTSLTLDEIVAAPGYSYKSHDSQMGTLTVDRVESAANDLWRSRAAKPA